MQNKLKRKIKNSKFKQVANTYTNDYAYRGCHNKDAWKGVSVGNAFNPNIDYTQRLQAQRTFYAMCKQAQKFAANIALGSLPKDFKPAIQPQLGPCYTNYPAGFAAFAAIGLTAFLEFKHWAGDRFLSVYLKEYLSGPAEHDMVRVDKETYKAIAQNVTQKVQTRLLLEDLSRYTELSSVEIYRLFGASQQNLRFESVIEILEAVILFGDILPDWKDLNLHPVTRVLFSKIDEVSDVYFRYLLGAKPSELVQVGAEWVIDICKALAPHLPKPANEEEEQNTGHINHIRDIETPRFSNKKKPLEMSEQIPPLNKPKPPALFQPKNQMQQVISDMIASSNVGSDTSKLPDGEKSEELKAVENVLKQFNEALDRSCGQGQGWEDMRSDVVERTLKNTSFSKGPIEGNPTDGHSVNVSLGGNKEATGEIFDRPVELSDNDAAYQILANEAEPITRSLKRILYPNVERIPETQRICSGGVLDPDRIALALCSDTIFKRYITVEEPDKRGRPLLLIVCDGSGSLNKNQMGMLKTLSCAWLNATSSSHIEVMAALYHTGTYRENRSGPLVQWIYHPRKTPATSRKDAARALVTLPDNGAGGQHDALSLAFLIEEARMIARGRTVYLVLITDCEWCQSFRTGMSAIEEVYNYFEWVYADMGDKLHTTLVTLGVEKETGFEGLLDQVIKISRNELNDYLTVAERVSNYVATCIKEQKRHGQRKRVA